jgi:hypothetical protein
MLLSYLTALQAGYLIGSYVKHTRNNIAVVQAANSVKLINAIPSGGSAKPLMKPAHPRRRRVNIAGDHVFSDLTKR